MQPPVWPPRQGRQHVHLQAGGGGGPGRLGQCGGCTGADGSWVLPPRSCCGAASCMPCVAVCCGWGLSVMLPRMLAFAQCAAPAAADHPCPALHCCPLIASASAGHAAALCCILPAQVDHGGAAQAGGPRRAPHPHLDWCSLPGAEPSGCCSVTRVKAWSVLPRLLLLLPALRFTMLPFDGPAAAAAFLPFHRTASFTASRRAAGRLQPARQPAPRAQR